MFIVYVSHILNVRGLSSCHFMTTEYARENTEMLLISMILIGSVQFSQNQKAVFNEHGSIFCH